MALLPQSSRLQFDELSAADAAFILELVNEPGWLQHIGDRQIHDLTAAEGYISKGPVASYLKNGFGLYRISLREGRAVIGLCGLIRRDTLEHPDIGYAFLQRHHGRGYACEAVQAVLDHARQTLGQQRLLAITSLDNHASIRVLEKSGFQFERLMQDGALGGSKLFAWSA